MTEPPTSKYYFISSGGVFVLFVSPPLPPLLNLPRRYLVESIRKFSNQEELKARLETAGFTNVTYTNMTGGIVAVHSGYKPL